MPSWLIASGSRAKNATTMYVRPVRPKRWRYESVGDTRAAPVLVAGARQRVRAYPPNRPRRIPVQAPVYGTAVLLRPAPTADGGHPGRGRKGTSPQSGSWWATRRLGEVR
ncbi:hypothetical protein GCM10009740_04070 [Terrabacter terrae]|uniref:Uncharacterized protein n=1 Tax=Terrabacter terrae TaxID=318434 RepID=A0ABN2TRY1_9MICO